MQDASRAVRARLDHLASAHPDLVARVQLFGLLILLVPLFAGLQHITREGIPRVEVRFVPHDVPVMVPVERIVERIIYVPVPEGAQPGQKFGMTAQAMKTRPVNIQTFAWKKILVTPRASSCFFTTLSPSATIGSCQR